MGNPKQEQQGTGSLENTGKDRDEQKQPLRNLSNQQRISGEDIDEGNHTIADLGELGMEGGLGDYSSDFGDSMKTESFNELTER